MEAPKSSFLLFIQRACFAPSEGRCLGRCERASIFFLVNSFHMINCRELYRNPLELKSQPSWMLRSKGLKHNKSADIQQREFLWNICRRLLPLKGACKFSHILSWTSCLADHLELSKITGPLSPRLSKLFIFLKIVSHSHASKI